MPLNKAKGNMYPFVTHTHTHLGGRCPHECAYCYVDNPRFGRPARYQGELRLIEDEFTVEYGEGRTIFVEHMNDLWAAQVPAEWRERVMAHCRAWRKNVYVFQTKNPGALADMRAWRQLPTRSLWGCTIETTESISTLSLAPEPFLRAWAMYKALGPKFISIEPILEPFDVRKMLCWIRAIQPVFVTIGADSKGHRLPEPPASKIEELIKGIHWSGICTLAKRNLGRILGKEKLESLRAEAGEMLVLGCVWAMHPALPP